MTDLSCDSLATSCGPYCGFCRFFMNEECGGCGSPDRFDCEILKCCRSDKDLQFCTECEDFPCKELRNSIGLDPRWLEELAELPLKSKES